MTDTARPPIPMYDIADGYAFVAAPDGGPLEWRVADESEADRHICRHSTRQLCPNRVVASLQRGRSRGRHYYCPEHMYGRWIEGGRVMAWLPRKVAAS